MWYFKCEGLLCLLPTLGLVTAAEDGTECEGKVVEAFAREVEMHGYPGVRHELHAESGGYGRIPSVERIDARPDDVAEGSADAEADEGVEFAALVDVVVADGENADGAVVLRRLGVLDIFAEAPFGTRQHSGKSGVPGRVAEVVASFEAQRCRFVT